MELALFGFSTIIISGAVYLLHRNVQNVQRDLVKISKSQTNL